MTEYKGQDTSKVHLWVGNNDREDYFKYFELDYSVDLGEPEYRVCQFCKDIAIEWYDEDWIMYFQHPKKIALDELLKELSVSEDVFETIKKKCMEAGFVFANAMFCYYDADLIIHDKQKSFNHLKYVGEFDTELGYKE